VPQVGGQPRPDPWPIVPSDLSPPVYPHLREPVTLKPVDPLEVVGKLEVIETVAKEGEAESIAWML